MNETSAMTTATLSDLQRQMDHAYARMSDAERAIPCRCELLPEPHVKALCASLWHSRSWHAGGPCDCSTRIGAGQRIAQNGGSCAKGDRIRPGEYIEPSGRSNRPWQHVECPKETA